MDPGGGLWVHGAVQVADVEEARVALPLDDVVVCQGWAKLVDHDAM